MKFWRVKQILKKEFILLKRDPRMRFVLIIPPLFQFILFGYAANNDIRNIPTLVVDRDRTYHSRDFVRRFEGTGYFTIIERTDDPKRMAVLMDRGRVKAIIHIGKGFAKKIMRRREAVAQVIVDGTDSTTASQVSAYTAGIVGAFTAEILKGRLTYLKGLMLAMGRTVPAEAGLPRIESRVWFNPELASRNFFIPGVIATIVLITTILLTSMAIVREREQGTLEQLSVTPLRAWEFIIGKTIPFALVGYFNVTMVTVLGTTWFGVPLRGSVGLLFIGTTLFLLTALGVGLFISTISMTLQQAMMTTFFFLFPTITLSGFMFPIRNMPEIVQYLTYLNPLRYFLVIIRSVFLKGSGFEILWPQMTALTVLGAAAFFLSARRLKRMLQ